MTKDEALKLALEALERISDRFDLESVAQDATKAITAIKEALAQPEQEPVARVIDNGTLEGATEWIPFANRVEPLKTGDFLYTTPPQRPWVGLTDKEVIEISHLALTRVQAVQMTEAKLREKNA